MVCASTTSSTSIVRLLLHGAPLQHVSWPRRVVTTVGLVPWKSGTYDVNGFNVTNLSLRATKAIHISKSFELPLYGEIIANPASQHFYFVFGLTLNAL